MCISLTLAAAFSRNTAVSPEQYPCIRQQLMDSTPMDISNDTANQSFIDSSLKHNQLEHTHTFLLFSPP